MSMVDAQDQYPSGAVSNQFDPLTLFWSGSDHNSPRDLRPGDEELADVLKLRLWHGPEPHFEFVTADYIAKRQKNDYGMGKYKASLCVFADNASHSSRVMTISLTDHIRRTEIGFR
jgi:hypothetical protein